MWDEAWLNLLGVPHRLRQQLAAYLRKARGDLTYAQFGRRLGISSSSLQRLEMAEQNITIDSLERLMRRLQVGMADIFRV
jgi:transcriptional regulator with XRE-family HTH domain